MNNFSKLKTASIWLWVVLLLSFSSVIYANAIDAASTATSDTVITTKIKTQYAKSPLLSAFDISVTTKKGKVYLSGLLDSTIQYQRAIELAHDVKGVKRIDASALNVKLSKQPQKDSEISSTIAAKLIASGLTTARNPTIVVEAENGVVYLDGYVSSKNERKLALDIAKSVNGVQKVKDDLRIVD